MLVHVNGIILFMEFYGSTGYTNLGYGSGYEITVNFNLDPSKNIYLPSTRTLKYLAKKYMESPLEVFYRSSHQLSIGIQGRLSQEKRCAFLAAVAARSTSTSTAVD